TCQPLGIAGEVCATSKDCRPPLFCRTSSSSLGVGVCATVGIVGDRCDTDPDCAEGLLCTLGTCVVPPTVGAPCYHVCDDTSFCRPAVDGGICQARFDAGVECHDSQQCQTSDVCATGSRRCVPAQVTQSLATCVPPQQCPTGNICVFG